LMSNHGAKQTASFSCCIFQPALRSRKLLK
jgi:hypothetical protein